MQKFAFALATIFSVSSFADGNNPYCAESILEIGLDETGELAFSARDLLRLAHGSHQLPWSWDYKEATTTLAISVRSVARTARYIDSVAVYPVDAPAIAIACPDRLEVDAWIDFTTSDGAFAERWSTTIFATDGTDCVVEDGKSCAAPGSEANFVHQFDLRALNGTFYSDVAVPEDITVDFHARGAFRDAGASVTVSGRAYSCIDDACYSYLIDGGHSL